MNQQHENDAAGNRDVDQEGKDIKTEVRSTQTKPPSKTNISFTSLAQSAIPNLSLQKFLQDVFQSRMCQTFSTF